MLVSIYTCKLYNTAILEVKSHVLAMILRGRAFLLGVGLLWTKDVGR